MPDRDAPKKPTNPLRTAALLFLTVGIGGNAVFQQQGYEGPLRDLTRLSVIAALVLFIVAVVQDRKRA